MHQPIGLFDSGFGGLTVMREIMQLLPQEDLIYLGDTAHLPYGNKSPETVIQYALENASFLQRKNIKMLVVPCHTACSHALQVLKKNLSIPVLGVIEPGLNLIQKYSRVAVLATTSTIESKMYQSLILKTNPKIHTFAKSCPLFVPLVEEGLHSHPAAELIAESYLAPLRGQIDAALLACTHYPLIRPVIQKILGADVKLIEPAQACANDVAKVLEEMGLLNRQKCPPRYEFYASDDPEKFQYLGSLFLGRQIEKVEKKPNF